MTKYTKKQIIEACELRERGLTYRQIAMRVGMHPASIIEYCQEYGAVSPHVTKPCPAPSFTPALDDEIRRLRAGGMSHTKIAKAVGRPLKSVRNRLRSLAFNEAKLEAAGAAP